MADITLTLSEQPSSIDKGYPTYITIDTVNVASIAVTISDTSYISYELTEPSDDSSTWTLALTGLKETSSGQTIAITIVATASDQTTKTVMWYTTVNVIETTLSVPDQFSTMVVGTTVQILATTNADEYTIATSNTDVIMISSQDNHEVSCVGVGTATITVTATKNYSVTKTVKWDVTTSTATEVDSGVAVRLRLKSQVTGRTIDIITKDNESTDDVLLQLPSHSGTLITVEDINSGYTVIEKPTIVYPSANATNYTGLIRATTFSTILGFTLDHTATTWEIALDEDFESIVWTQTLNSDQTDDLTSTTTDYIGSTLVYIRVKYYAEGYESAWSDPLPCYISNIPALHGLTEPVATTDTCAYYGIVTSDMQVQSYNYRGVWQLINDHYNTSLYADNYSTGTPLYIGMCFDVGDQVYHNGKLWRAVKYLTATTNDEMVEPGTDESSWVEDTRTALPIPSVISDMIGIGHGIYNNNCDSMSTGATSIGELINTDEGYIKYIHNGKLCYTPKKPLCDTIAWTDLAKRDVVYNKERSIRLGSSLFWIRLIQQDEYEELFTNLTNGTYDNFSSDDLGLDIPCWIEDEQEGTSRYVMSGTNELSTLDPKSRTGGWRWVLEYIPEATAPYKLGLQFYKTNTPKATTFTHQLELDGYFNGEEIEWGTGERFIYDRYTDTGYFGVVSSDDLIAGDALATACSFTSGSALSANYTAGWLKFYYHGKIVFMAKKPYRYNMSANALRNAYLTFGKEMGGWSPKYVEIDGIRYYTALPTGNRSDPGYTKYAMNKNYSKTQVVITFVLQYGKYSMWNELMYRMSSSSCTATKSDKMVGYEYTAGSNWTYSNNYRYIENAGGHLIGGPWEALDQTEFRVNISASGTNGCSAWHRENNNYCGNTSYGVAIGNRGLGHMFTGSTFSTSNNLNEKAWRPTLYYKN